MWFAFGEAEKEELEEIRAEGGLGRGRGLNYFWRVCGSGREGSRDCHTCVYVIAKNSWLVGPAEASRLPNVNSKSVADPDRY